MHNCDKHRDEIWEFVETGEMSDDLLSALHECESCRLELGRAKSAMQGFELFRTADAPDCNREVMAKICASGRRGFTILAYSLGLVLVAAIAMNMLVLHPHVNNLPDRKTAKNATLKQNPSVKMNVYENYTAARAWQKMKTPNKQALADKDIRPNRTKKSHPMIQVQKHLNLPEQPTISRLQPIFRHDKKSRHYIALGKHEHDYINQADEMEDSLASNAPVAIIVLDESPVRQQSDWALDYGYTQTNTETGDTIICSVRKKEDSVEINMEMKPASKIMPMKGSLKHDKENNA